MKRGTKNAKPEGFTLPELLVTCILLSMVALIMAGFLTGWLQSYANTKARTDLLQNAELALDQINKDIRLSGAADSSNRWPDANAPSGGWQSDADTLILAEAATDSSRNVIFADPSKYITVKDNVIYFLDGQNLYRRVLASDNSADAARTTCPPAASNSSCPADSLVAAGVTNFDVKYYDARENQVAPTDARSIDLSITLTSKSTTKTIAQSYHTRMVFRNE